MALVPKTTGSYGLPGVYNLGALTLNDNDSSCLQLDATGALKAVLSTTGAAVIGANANQVQGNSASGAADVGNPVKVGGIYNLSAPTFTDGMRGDLQLDASGNLKTVASGSSTGLRSTLQASAAKTTTNNSSSLAIGGYKEAVVTLNVTAASGTVPTLDVKIQTSDDGGTTWFDLPGVAFAQVTAATTKALQITNFGDTIRAVSTITGTTPSFTYAIKLVAK